MDTEKQRLYDEIVGMTLTNILIESNIDEKIYITPFNVEDKAELFYLRIAFMVQDLSDKKIVVDCSFKDYWKVRRKYKKRKIKKYNKFFYKRRDELSDCMKILAFESERNKFPMSTFADIYDEYYKEGDN